MPPTRWRVLLGVGAVLVAVSVLSPVAAVADVTYVAVGSIGAVAVLVGTRRNRPRRTGPWTAFTAGLGLWVLGDVALFGGAPGLSDALYVTGYLPLAVGLVLLTRARVAGRDLAGVLDAAVLALALALALWVFLGAPVVRDPGLTVGETAVQLSFVLGDLLLLGGLVRIATGPGSRILPLRLLVGAVGLVVLADVLTLGLRTSAGVTEPLLSDVGYLASYLLWGAAAMHPRMGELTEREAPTSTVLSPLRLVALGLASTTGTWCLGVQALLGRPLATWPVVLGTAAIVVVVLARLRLAFGEIVTAHRESTVLRDRLAHEAAHDHLTGLPNRARGLVLLGAALDRVRHEGGSVTVLFFDLDGFKKVNDTVGHRAGDRLLVEVSHRLRNAVRDGDVALRLGGDEFVVVLSSLRDGPAALGLAHRLISTVSEPVSLGAAGTARVGASVGIAQCHDGTTAAVTLLDEADMAAYRAKREGRGRAVLFDRGMRSAARDAESLLVDLRQAVDGDQLELHFQPVLEVDTGSVRGWEALVRWNRPGHGQLLPGAFLPAAERADLVGAIDRWVAAEATAQLARWAVEAPGPPRSMALNVSRRRLLQEDFVPELVETVREAGLRTSQLVLEADHALVVTDPAVAARLAEARGAGVRVAFSDFDAGFRTLRALGRLPVDLVKIGPAFLEMESSEDVKLLHLTIEGARAVGLDVVAQGVERSVQLATLRALDCAMVQGYHLAGPLPAKAALAHLRGLPADRFSGLRR